MRTYKDAKAMAKSLRDSMAARSILLSHSECIEIVAKQFGFADWNTLSAKLALEFRGPEDAVSRHLTSPTGRNPPLVSNRPTHEQIFCSFCGKSKQDVRRLIEGGCRNPVHSQCVFICDECVVFSAQVIVDLEGDANKTPELTG
jgi:hypothetical protein